MSFTASDSDGRQNMRALQHANRIRLARAQMKRNIAAGDIHVADVILEPPEEVEGMDIADLLTSQKRWGTTRCSRFMDSIGLPETKTVRSLTERQRAAVATVLKSRRPSADLAAAVTFRSAA